MTNVGNVAVATRTARATDAIGRLQSTLQEQVEEAWIPKPFAEPELSTMGASSDTGTRQFIAPGVTLPPIDKMGMSGRQLNSMPVEIWEGTVQRVNDEARTMAVVLEPKLQRDLSRHSAEISLNYVSDQDRPLVQPGAVFYLTIFVKKMRTTIQNSEEIRFRRMPSWSRAHIKRIKEGAATLLAAMED